ncbi:MAG: MraZ protein [Myxococcota bacterium]|jgi:MraZ protein
MQYEPFHVELTMDPKGRVTLPVQLRMALRVEGTNQLVAVANEGDRGGISLFTLARYRELLTTKLSTVDPFDPRSPDLLFFRAIIATNHTLTIDGSGRILLSAPLRELADLSARLFMFSVGAWFEIWSTDRWRERHPALVQQWLDTPTTTPTTPAIAS